MLPAMVERSRASRVHVLGRRSLPGAYESPKAAQVALSSSLEGELSGTGVVAFTIGLGLVPTETAVAAVHGAATLPIPAPESSGRPQMDSQSGPPGTPDNGMAISRSVP